MKLFHRSPVNRQCGEFLPFPTLGPPIHTLTIFANPFLEGKPSLEDAGVLTVEPGDQAPTEGDWHTLYFLPGVHDIGLNFTIHSVMNSK